MYKILIADPEPLVLTKLRSVLDWARLDAEICGAAADGRTALRIAREQSPDIVITDIHMPEMDGLELIRRCRSFFHPAILPRFIILTSCKDFRVAREAISCRVFDYLLKSSLTPELLKSSVLEAIESLPRNQSLPKTVPDCPNHLVSSVKKYVSAHIEEKLSLTKVAAVFDVNPSYLSQLFGRYNGTGFNEYVNVCKITEGKRLLEKGNLKIYEVAELLGFENAFYFSKVFKRVEGMSPTAYLNGLP